jgi:hypothetical protein
MIRAFEDGLSVQVSFNSGFIFFFAALNVGSFFTGKTIPEEG